MTEFNIGDNIRIVTTPTQPGIRSGQLGVISSSGVSHGGSKWYWVDLESGRRHDTWDYNMELVDKDVIDYLTEAGHPLRIKALKALIDRDAFTNGLSVSERNEIINAYLEKNPDNFCDSGIRRFREACGLVTEKQYVTVSVRWESSDTAGQSVSQMKNALGRAGWVVNDLTILATTETVKE